LRRYIEGAFERCFNIIREEGAADGGIIVQDCLELCNNLLRGRGLHSSSFRRNVSIFCWIGVVQGLFRGCLGGVRGY